MKTTSMPRSGLKVTTSFIAILSLLTYAESQANAGGEAINASNQSEKLSVIVVLDEDFAPGNSEENRAEAANIARSMRLHAKHVYGTALYGFSSLIPAQRLQSLRNHPLVAYVQMDEVLTIPTPPDRAQKPRRCTDDPTGPGCGDNGDGDGDSGENSQQVPWGISRIGAPVNGNTGAGIDIYIIDTGIDVDHEDLYVGTGFAAVNCIAKGKNKSCFAPWDDDNGHGTHVAGTVGALDNDLGVVGIAPGVTLHAVKVLNSRGSGLTSDIIAGINWVATQVSVAPVVANMSLGGGGSKTGTCDATGYTGTDAYHEAMCGATRSGVVFAVAAGNSGADSANFRPAAYDDVAVAVSAIGQIVDTAGNLNGQYGWPDWSNWGDTTAGWTDDTSAPVAIAAPGMGILSTWKGGGYDTISGTSMASPHVAGALALFLQANPQEPEYTAFLNARAALLLTEESTATGLFTVRSGKPHDEDFVDAEALAN